MPRAGRTQVRAGARARAGLVELQVVLYLGFEPVGNPPDEFDTFFKNELAKWGKLIRDNNIQAN